MTTVLGRCNDPFRVMINRKQIGAEDLENRPRGVIYFNEKGRKEVAVSFQKRKQDEIQHQLLEQKVPLGLIRRTQARLLAQYIRGAKVAGLRFHR